MRELWSADATQTATVTARRYIEVGQPGRALEVLGSLPDGGPEAMELRGWAYLALEDHDAAAHAAGDVLEEDPTATSALLLLSMAEELRGRLGSAERAVLVALEQDPDDAQVLCQYASVLMRGGQLDKADRLVEVAARRDPGSPDVLGARLALAYLRRDDDRATALARELLEQDPESAQGHRMLGAVALDRGHVLQAAERLGEAVRLDPEHEPTAEAARAAREFQRPFYAPVRFFEHYGVGRTWIAYVVLAVGLRGAGLLEVAGVVTIVWFTLCIWSWIASAVLARRLR